MGTATLYLMGAALACVAAPAPKATPQAASAPAGPATAPLEPGSACRDDGDCAFGIDHPIEKPEDCRSDCCSVAVMNRPAAERLQAASKRICAARSHELRAPCASATCEMRGAPQCVRGRCAEVAPENCARPLTLAQAQQRPDGLRVCFDAYLVMLPVPCPPCPENATCEACLPPYAQISGDPPAKAGPATASAWVDRLECASPGSRVRLSGTWEAKYGPGYSRIFSASTCARVDLPLSK
jgi:hypothetical protein